MPPAPGSGFPGWPLWPPGLLLPQSRALQRLLSGPTSAPPAHAPSPLQGLHNQAPRGAGKARDITGVGAKESPQIAFPRLQTMQEGSASCFVYRQLGLGGVSPLFLLFSIFWHLRKVARIAVLGCSGRAALAPVCGGPRVRGDPPQVLSVMSRVLWLGPRSVRLTARDTTKTRTCRTWRKSSASVASAWRRSSVASSTRGTSCMPWRAKVRRPLSGLHSVQRASAHVGRELPVAGFVFRARVPHSRGSGDETRWSTGGGGVVREEGRQEEGWA